MFPLLVWEEKQIIQLDREEKCCFCVFFVCLLLVS